MIHSTPSQFWCQPCMFQLVELVCKCNQIHNYIYFLWQEMHIFSTRWHSFQVPQKDFRSFPVSNLLSFNLRQHTMHPFLFVFWPDRVIFNSFEYFIEMETLKLDQNKWFSNASQTVARCKKNLFLQEAKALQEDIVYKMKSIKLTELPNWRGFRRHSPVCNEFYSVPKSLPEVLVNS